MVPRGSPCVMGFATDACERALIWRRDAFAVLPRLCSWPLHGSSSGTQIFGARFQGEPRMSSRSASRGAWGGADVSSGRTCARCALSVCRTLPAMRSRRVPTPGTGWWFDVEMVDPAAPGEHVCYLFLTMLDHVC